MPTATPDTAVAPPHQRRTYLRLFGVTLAIPTLGSALGIDGGDMFQMVAVENLGLDARTIGIGLGFCVLSVPLQLWAARLSLGRARQRMQAFLLIDTLLCWILAALILTAAPGSWLAISALALAVLAEISLSVLYATAWQPLLSLVLESPARQRVNAQGRGTARGVMAVLLLVFGLANETTRVAFLVALGFVALWLARVVSRVQTPTPYSDHGVDVTPGRRWELPPGMWALSVTAGLAATSAWPLFITYTHDVLWPDVNLGLVASAMLSGHVVAGLLWRTTEAGLARRARLAACGSVVAALVLSSVRAPVDGSAEGVLVLTVVLLAAVAISTLMMCIMELAHQTVDHASSVRSLTIFDVLTSTSFQAGLFVTGFLVSISADSTWAVDPYRIYLLTMAAVVALVVLRPRWPAGGPGWSAARPGPRRTRG